MRSVFAAGRAEFLQLNFRTVAFLFTLFGKIILIFADRAQKHNDIPSNSHTNPSLLKVRSDLFQDLGYHAGSDGMTAFANSEANTFFESHWGQ